MNDLLINIQLAKSKAEKLLAILVDPDKFDPLTAPAFVRNLPNGTTHLFIGGSTVVPGLTQTVVQAFKMCTALPIVLFPGDYSQLSRQADAVLYLSLLSGTNPEYLVGQQLKAVPFLAANSIAVIPTGYILIDGGHQSAVARVTGTKAIDQSNLEHIVALAQMAEFLGKQLLYLEAGSGAKIPVSMDIIKAVRRAIKIPIIVGGGIRTDQALQDAYTAGADLVVMGTVFEH